MQCDRDVHATTEEPAFQHQGNVDALCVTSGQQCSTSNCGSPCQWNTNQYGSHSVSRGAQSGLWSSSEAARPNFQELYHQQKSLASTASTGSQHSEPMDNTYTPLNSLHQLSRIVNTDFHSLVHVSVRRSNSLKTSANKSCVRQSVYNRGHQREYSERSFSGHFLKESNLNTNTRLQERQHQCSSVSKQKTPYPLLYTLLTENCPSSKFITIPSSSSSVETNASIELSNTSTYDRHCKNQQMKSSLDALSCEQTRTRNPNHSRVNSSTPHQQQVTSSSLRGQPSTDKVSLAGEMQPPTNQQIEDFIAKRVEYFKKVLTQKEGNYGYSNSNNKWNFCTNDSTLQSDCSVPTSNSSTDLSATLASDKEYFEGPSVGSSEQWTAAVGQALQDGRSKDSIANDELTPTSKEKGDWTHLTEYPQIMANVAATCTKNEDENPVVLKAVSEMTLDTLTENQPPSLMLRCSSPLGEYKSLCWDINKNLDEMDQVPNVFRALKNTTEKEKGYKGLKPVEAVGLDSVEGVNGILEDFRTKSSSVVNGNSKLNSSIDQTHNVISVPTNQSEQLWSQTSHEGAMEDADSPHLQTDLSLSLSESKVKAPPLLPESKGEDAHSVKIVKDPQYEDISGDEDTSPPLANLPNKEHEDLRSTPCFEDPQYEDISEDENPQIESLDLETPSLTQVAEPNNERSLLENVGCEQVQGQAQVKTENISDEKLIPKKEVTPKTGTLDTAKQYSCPHFGETNYGFDQLLGPKCDSERYLEFQTDHPVSCDPSVSESGLETLSEDGHETDDEIDDDWIVIPISMSGLKFEPEDDAQDVSEKAVPVDGETVDKERQGDGNPAHCYVMNELYCAAPKPVPASASSEIEVFDTVQSFLQAKAMQFGMSFDAVPGRSTPEHEMDSEGEPHMPQRKAVSYSEPEDSCETEDSCDYSSTSERNFLTVPWELLAPLSSETEDSEKESECNEATDVQKGQTGSQKKLGCLQKLREIMETKAASKHIQAKTSRQQIPKKQDIITLDSDTEDESDQNYKKRAKRKRSFTSCSEESRDAPFCHERGHPPETVDSLYRSEKEKLQNKRPPPADSLSPRRQSKLYDKQFEEEMQEVFPNLPHSTESGWRQTETKPGSEDVQQKTDSKDISTESIIILDSDTENDNDQNYIEASRGKTFSSGLVDGSNALLQQQQKRHTLETVDGEYGTAKGDLQEARSSADSSVPQHRSELRGAQEVMQEARPKQVPHKTSSHTTSNRRNIFHDFDKDIKNNIRISKKKAVMERTVSSVSKDNDLPEKQPKSMYREADKSSSPKLVIPRLFVKKSSQPNDRLELLKDSKVHRRSKDESPAPKTPKASSKKMGSCQKNKRHLYRNKQGQFVSKPKPADDGLSVTRNKVQANITKPRPILRQLSLPSLEGPSTSTSSLTSNGGQLPEARQSSASSRGLSQSEETTALSSLSKTMQNTLVPRHLPSYRLKRSHSYSNPSPLDQTYTATKVPSSYSNMAKEQVTKDWHNSFVPTRRDRKATMQREEALKTANYESRREARPGHSHRDRAPRRRHRSHEFAAPLLKRTKFEAIQHTKAMNHKTIRQQRYSVGEGYKWSEKPRVARPTKDSIRERKRYQSPQRPYQ
ncbi:uncharacterized protein LOC121176273 isoform X2 [Toxotes jaculatrix]|uniref:uncharacterized protein LOC121176273 isoform X2 n=1 Tax=Toxotes jaculatrix TaxID=941984 RepID=UPI001B3AAC66|nr:uncharacterized protein LOC121176273 isoform X2 [Toxotes jaculatrix]